MIEQTRRLLVSIVAALFPPQCALCGSELPSLDIVCSSCISQLPTLGDPQCQRCGESIEDGLDLCVTCGTQRHAVDRVLCLGPYRGAWGNLVRGFKFDHEMAIGRWLGRQLAETLRRSGLIGRLDAVTYVPMTRRDRRHRGFNQAKILARVIARETQLPLVPTLTKSRPTALQARLSAQDRRTNLRGAFRPVPCSYGQVLLVDDIYTTGSTVEECARTLKQGGMEWVVAITVARA